MERKTLVLCSVVGLLGLVSAATGFGAEATRIKEEQFVAVVGINEQRHRGRDEEYKFTETGSKVQFTSATQCTYPRSPALGLGLTAAVTLTIAQVIINVATGFTYVIAFLLLLTGAALNDQHGEESLYFGNYYCYVVKPGVFAAGAVLAFTSVTLGILYYLTLNSAKNGDDPWKNPPVSNQSGIAMGQPQFAPQSTQEPVFVHEDTYVRRQFT
ncbi:unnamed protein product [Dovyalis caffra]|uniref:Uncharacterized protein n=1 Tax=Dovyalis caffra TaxID=77055 RepID=A0AAV1RXQ5_9ROSI|nr:unnamed protein product [Dovyalis caffra]